MTPLADLITTAAGARVIKRSVRVAGHPTSVSLEDPFWSALRAIADQESLSLDTLIGRIDAARTQTETGNLSSALRVFTLEWHRRTGAPPLLKPPSAS